MKTATRREYQRVRIWIDVEDIFAFALTGGGRPTGIQRLAFELVRAMIGRDGADRIRLLRHDRLRGGFFEVPYDSLVALFGGLTGSHGATAHRPPARRRLESALRDTLRPLADRLPREVRTPLVRAARAQFEALAATVSTARALLGLVRRRLARAPGAPTGDTAAFEAAIRRGDMLFAPGAAFVHRDYAARLADARTRLGLRTALLVYDIIPVRRPEFVDRAHAAIFRAWLDSTLPECDVLMAISRSAASEAEDHATRHAIPLRGPIHPVPIGTGFGDTPPPETERPPHLPPAGTYVLFVSTLEARKNHLLLFRVWRRLLDIMPPDQVPTLVFAGRVGWMVGDLMQQLENTNWLDGKVTLVDRPDDAALAALYRGCLFTVFPSFYEGWGLPVSESLSFGKPCIASHSTSLPEAGGALTRYFDPDNIAEATDLIRATLADRPALAAWEAQVRAEFAPTQWDTTAEAVLKHLA